MFVKVRGTKVGVNGFGVFVINVDNIKSIELLGDTKILYLLGDAYGITLINDDFENLVKILDIKNCIA
ncbi:MAG: hypothetical protein FWD54_03635 [Endomicrobia bacterium]|nr:hypothetical protein [Endomicrobiia bacterium]MCL2799349.1 hypothetical protein [Endomicrobiia bacterium]